MQPHALISGTDNARGASAEVSWYALRVRSNHERAVARLLDLRGFESFLPVYSAESRWSDRTKKLERVLFPGYVFAHVEEIAPTLDVAGVCSVLGGVRPAVIPESEIESVRLVIASMRPLVPVVSTDFVLGDRVTVQHGALKGASGIVQRVKNTLRLIVSIELMGRAVAVELDANVLDRRAAA